MTSFLDDRRRGAEEAFFARQNEQLRVGLRKSDQVAANSAELAAASGLRNSLVLDSLTELNVGPEGAAALSLTPLVAVAWADGDVSPKERTALLAAARDAGLAETDASYRLFASWLDAPPSAALMSRWKDYATTLLQGMSPEAAAAFRQEILDRARAIAASAGGLLGFGGVSEAERAVLAEIEAALRLSTERRP
jgi:tellurite resistance protein